MAQVTLSGNTYPVKEELKAIGAKWNNAITAWVIDETLADKAKDIISKAPPKKQYGGGETKRCWECGCEFTYADANQHDGDWSDSYCGC